MVDEARSDSETDEISEKTSSDELQNCKNGRDDGISEYEKQRLSRIRENRERLEALGLPSLASSLLGSVEKKVKRKGKGKKEEDDDYKPSDGEGKVSSSSEEDKEVGRQVRNDGSSASLRTSIRKGKKKHSLNMRKTNKKTPIQKRMGESDFFDDDEALQQAIALSLGSSSEVSGAILCEAPQNSRQDVDNVDLSERKGGGHVQESAGRKKKRKANSSRVQMTEDQVIIHFFHFDEAGKGNITMKDLQRVAIAHDFTWTDNEMADMINSFDSDGDGKLSLDDFRRITYQCNMVQGCENALTGLKS